MIIQCIGLGLACICLGAILWNVGDIIEIIDEEESENKK